MPGSFAQPPTWVAQSGGSAVRAPVDAYGFQAPAETWGGTGSAAQWGLNVATQDELPSSNGSEEDRQAVEDLTARVGGDEVSHLQQRAAREEVSARQEASGEATRVASVQEPVPRVVVKPPEPIDRNTGRQHEPATPHPLEWRNPIPHPS